MACRPDPRLWLVAAALLSLAPASAAPPGRQPLVTAEAALANGDGIAAEVAAREALASGAPREAVAALMGEAELVQGDLAGARGWLEPGRFSPPTRQRGFHALARLEVIQGDFAAAARAFDQALAQGEDNAPLWVDIARLRYGNGEHRLAIAAADRALAADPADPRALELRGQLLRDNQGLIAAIDWLEKALDAAPDDLGLLGEYAATLGEAGRNRDMLRVARRMVEIDPRHPRAYYLQAVLAARAGLDDLARRLLWRTGGAYDELPAAMLLQGVLDLRTGNAALAVEQFDALARRQPDNPTVALLLARALLANGEPNEIVARFGFLADAQGTPPYLLALVGRAYEHLGKRAEAARYLDRSAETMPALPEVLPVGRSGDLAIWRHGEQVDAAAAVPLLRRMMSEGRHAEATAHAAALLDSYPESADVERLAGDVFLLTGDPAAALDRYRRAAAVRRDFALVERMAFALRATSQPDAAQALLADYLEQNPRSAAASAMLGRSFGGRGDWPRAATLMRHAASLSTGDPLLLVDLAEAELAAGNVEAAEIAARRAHTLHRANGAVAPSLSRVIAASGGDEREAEIVRARALRTAER